MATVSIDFSSSTVLSDPHPTYRVLRANTPVVFNTTTNSWLVSRYHDILAILNDERISSARVDATFSVLPDEVQAELQPLRTVLNSRMLLSDPPAHTRLKNLVQPAFAARVTERRRERIEEICVQLLDRLPTDGTFDVMGDFANIFPGWVTGDILGVPVDQQQQFSDWSHDQVRIYDRPGTVHERIEVMRRGQKSMLAMKAFLESIIAERRQEPRDDVISMLVAAEEDGERLSNDELIAMVVAILVGGNNSTSHLIGNAIYTLLHHPEAVSRISEDPALIRSTIEEVLRYQSPVQSTSRVTKADIELGGEMIPAGSNVHVLLASGNRDPGVFDNADDFVIDRRPNRHLTFGHGPHYCLGTSLGRTMAATAVGALLQRYPRMQLASETADWNPGFSFRSLRTLPIAIG